MAIEHTIIVNYNKLCAMLHALFSMPPISACPPQAEPLRQCLCWKRKDLSWQQQGAEIRVINNLIIKQRPLLYFRETTSPINYR